MSRAITNEIQRSVAAWRIREAMSGEFVIVYRGEICGWKKKLDEAPRDLMPGCEAYDNWGNCVAVTDGGTDYHGADRWLKLAFEKAV